MSHNGDDAPTPAGDSLSTRLMQIAGQTSTAQPDFDKVRADVAEQRLRLGTVPNLFGKADREGAFERNVAEARRLVAKEPNSPLAQLRLADALRDSGAHNEAIELYRRCAETDGTEIPAGYFLAALGDRDTPGTMPPEMVVSLFDHYADTFEDTLVRSLKYQGPRLLFDSVTSVVGDQKRFLDIADAGCGTGLCGEVFRPMARRLDGIDLSPGMIAKAQSKGVYDELSAGELCALLKERSGRYDLVLAADVLIYIGDLDPVFDAVATALRRDGLFAFTTETTNSGRYALSRAGRFLHDDAYVDAVAARTGFDIARREDATIRFEYGAAVAGAAYVLRRT